MINETTKRHKQARRKAEYIMRLVQGNIALEGQGMDEETYKRLLEKTVKEFLEGSDADLWAK